MGAFERVGQVHVWAVWGQLGAAVAQCPADAQFAHRVRADHSFKAVKILREGTGLTGHGTRPLFHFDPVEGVFDDAE